MSIDDLAAMMSREFERTRAELKAEFKSDIHNSEVGLKGYFKTEIDRLDQRLAKLEFKLDELRDMLNHLEEVDILNLQKRVKELEQQLKQFKKQAGFK